MSEKSTGSGSLSAPSSIGVLTPADDPPIFHPGLSHCDESNLDTTATLAARYPYTSSFPCSSDRSSSN